MLNSILVVCVGNICRSPIGERLLQNYLPGKNIRSAGLKAMVGKKADANAITLARNHDLSLEEHKAQQLNAELCYKYDLILVMEKEHVNAVCNIAPEVKGKVMLYSHWKGNCDIVDPYGKSFEMFSHVYDLLEECAQKWAEKLSR